MEFPNFEEALADYAGIDFVIRLPNGIMASWWSRDLALAHERMIELHMLIESLSKDGLLDGYADNPRKWLADHIVQRGEQLGSHLVITRARPPNQGQSAAQDAMVDHLHSRIRELAVARAEHDGGTHVPGRG
jgi:hypothetical protein